MQGAFGVIGWVLWVLVLLWGLGTLGSRNSDGGIRRMMRTQGLVLLAACAATVLVPVSRYWLLAAIPVAFYLPMILMKRRAIGLQQRFAELLSESDRTDVPLGDLLERETRRLGGEEKGKTFDYYADLTDEERADEGLPPRESPKADPAPQEAPESEEEPEEEEEEPAEDDATGRLFEDIASLRGGAPMASPRWHWVWFGPLSLFVLAVTELHTIPYSLRIVQLAWHRWDWWALISPSGYLCSSVVFYSVSLPIQGLIYANATLFADGINWPASKQRYLYTVMLLAGVLLLPFVTDTLIWGSFPLDVDSHGVGHLRFIPFFPWPDRPYGSY